MKHYYSFLKIALLLIVTLVANQRFSWAQKLPAQVNTIVKPPYTLYLNDYFGPFADKIITTVVFNDFNEPSWDFKLRFTLQSNDIKIQTKEYFTPAAPITVAPGSPLQLTAADLTEYFNYDNLNFSGISKNSFVALPEGFYSFCFEVLDYNTNKLLGTGPCATVFLESKDPVKILTPICGDLLEPTEPQNILFQWQLYNAASVNSPPNTLSYQFSLYELLDPQEEPLAAINNGKALSIFESDWIYQSTYLYNISHPALTPGKQYLFRVQVKDENNVTTFKNEGYSEVCWFRYGFPQDGNIVILNPKDSIPFGKFDYQYFEWSAPDNKLPGQSFEYRIKIVEAEKDQDRTEAIEQNPVWYEQKFTPTSNSLGYEFTLKKKLNNSQEYVWQVKAFSKNKEVAKSIPSTFWGPPLLEKFNAGNHIVKVLKTQGSDLSDLSGTGEVKVGEDSVVVVAFANLNIKAIAGRYVLTEGEIIHEFENPIRIPLNPSKVENDTAYFITQKLRLNKEELSLEGQVRWTLPHPTENNTLAEIQTETRWVNFDVFTISAIFNLNTQNKFNLLEPQNFAIDFNTESNFWVTYNTYDLHLHGVVHMPENVASTSGNRLDYTFNDINNLLYFKSPGNSNNAIRLVKNTKIDLIAQSIIFDFSEDQSPGKKGADLSWKGAYFEKFQVRYETEVDKFEQLSLDQPITHNFTLTNGDQLKSWIEPQGLIFHMSKNFAANETGFFNTFPSPLTNIALDIENSILIGENYITGNFIIPIISNTKKMTYKAPITMEGIQRGFVEGIEGSEFTFNKDGGEQELIVRVVQGFAEANERFALTIDLEWPALGVELKSLTGFKAWGDYNVGFNVKNGLRALDEQLEGTLAEFPFMTDVIGAGNSEGHYSFGLSGKVPMAEDVAGYNGPPVVNVYSIVKNSLAPEGSEKSVQEQLDEAAEQYASMTKKEKQEVLQAHYVDNIYKNQAGLSQDIADQVNNHDYGYANANTTFNPNELKNLSVALKDMGVINENSFLYKFIQDLTVDQKTTFEDILLQIIEASVEEILSPITDPVEQKANEIIALISGKIDDVVSTITGEIEQKVAALLSSLKQSIINATKTDYFNPGPYINTVIDKVVTDIVQKITTSITNFANNGIKNPITSFIKNDFVYAITSHLRWQVAQIIFNSIQGDDVETQITQIKNGAGDLVKEIGQNFSNKIVDFMPNLAEVFKTEAATLLKELSPSEIKETIINALMASAGDMLEDALQDVAENALNSMLDEVGGGFGGDLAANLGIEMNFTELAKGNIGGAFSLDPSDIAINTPFLSLKGQVKLERDDPMFGNVFKAEKIQIHIKVPDPKKPFVLEGSYINGDKNGLKYWFCQLSGNSEGQPGGAMSKQAKELSPPLNIGMVKVVAAAGRLYHHMKELGEFGEQVVPDHETNYGAFMNFVLFDAARDGQTMRLEILGEVITKTNGDFTLDFEGNIQINSTVASVNKPDPNAVGQGMIGIYYNSAEKHFIGEAGVIVKKPGVICAEASLLVDVKPGAWRVAIGTKENKVKFQPLCMGWYPVGWLDVNQNTAELGLGLGFAMSHQFTVDIKIVKLTIGFDAGFQAGVMVKVQYNPSFMLMEAGLWAELWAKLYISYVTKVSSGTINLLDIYIYGELLMRFNPKPVTLSGKLNGYIKILCFGIDFDTQFSHSF